MLHARTVTNVPLSVKLALNCPLRYIGPLILEYYSVSQIFSYHLLLRPITLFHQNTKKTIRTSDRPNRLVGYNRTSFRQYHVIKDYMRITIFILALGFLLVGAINVYAIYNTNMSYLNPPLPEPVTMIVLGSGLFGLAGYIRKYKK